MSYSPALHRQTGRLARTTCRPDRLRHFRLAAVLALAFVAVPVHAQVVGVSNLDSAGSSTTRSANQFWGMAFTTDASAASFTLNSVTVAFRNFSSGTINDFFVQIRAYDGTTAPGAVLETLTGGTLPYSPPDSYVSTGMNRTWNSSGISLAANTSYFVIWGFTDGTGSYSVANRSDNISTGAWALAANAVTTNDGGGIWYSNSFEGMVQVSATAVPEPSTYAMVAGIGVLGVAAWRRRRSRSAT